MPSISQYSSAEGTLRTLCGSEQRYRVLRALYAQPFESMSLIELAKASGGDAGNTLRLLRVLARANLVEVTNIRPSPKYRPNRNGSLFRQLLALFSPDNFQSSEKSFHVKLDYQKQQIGELLLEHHSLKAIRAKSLENLRRWRAKNVWNDAYEQWEAILKHGSNAQLVKTMTSPDDESNRLRQSMPYVGLLDRKLLQALNEKVAA